MRFGGGEGIEGWVYEGRGKKKVRLNLNLIKRMEGLRVQRTIINVEN